MNRQAELIEFLGQEMGPIRGSRHPYRASMLVDILENRLNGKSLAQIGRIYSVSGEEIRRRQLRLLTVVAKRYPQLGVSATDLCEILNKHAREVRKQQRNER